MGCLGESRRLARLMSDADGMQRGARGPGVGKKGLERETGLEPATCGLEGRRSTN